MLAWLHTIFRPPRRPSLGLALAAIVGILAGDTLWVGADAGANAQITAVLLAAALAVFFGTVLLFWWRPRPALCWVAVVTGFASLHLLRLDNLPARVLARELPAGSVYAVRARGTVADEPRAPASLAPPRQGQAAPPSWRFILNLRAITTADAAWPSHAQVSAFWKNAGHKPVSGDRLDIFGLASNTGGPRNPGEFDYAGYLRRRGILSSLSLDGIADGRTDAEPAPWWQGAWLGPGTQHIHDWMDATLHRDLADDPEVPRLVTTVLLGLRDDPGLGDLEPLFQRTGTLHYFAIDGLKLGFLGWLLLTALTSLGLPRLWARALCLGLLLGYIAAAGIGAASLRAVVVAAVLLGGEWLDRPARASNSLGAAAALLLLYDTNQLFTLGFQLSFLVVLAILTLALPCRDWLRRCGAPDPFLPRLLYSRWLRAREWSRYRLIELTSVSLAAALGSLPLTLLAFHTLSPVSVPANVVAFPFAAGMFALAIFAVLGGAVWTTWAIWMNNANWVVAKALLAVLRLLDAIPGGSCHVASPATWRWPAPLAEITLLDLGPGRAVQVRAARADWLIDGGRLADYHRVVLPFLAYRGIDLLQGLLLTQNDSAHLAAAPQAMADLLPGRVLASSLAGRSPASRATDGALRQHALTAGTVARGTTVSLADRVRLRVLYPPPGSSNNRTAASARTLIWQLDAGGRRVLFLGDSNLECQRWLNTHAGAAELASAVVVVGVPPEVPEDRRAPDDAAVQATLFGLIQPQLVIQQRTSEGAATPALPAGSWQVAAQNDAGAVTLRLYADRLEASEFVTGRVRTISGQPLAH